MSLPIRALTLLLLALPLALLAGARLEQPFLAVPAALLAVIYFWIWLRFRPSAFIVDPTVLRIVWPLKCREIRREDIASVRILDGAQLKQEIGWGVRIGAGGLWGGFGWLWTKRRRIVQMYVSRADRFVWIERGHGRPWLITPERPDAFARTLSGR
jgi:hypothetical protein